MVWTERNVLETVTGGTLLALADDGQQWVLGGQPYEVQSDDEGLGGDLLLGEVRVAFETPQQADVEDSVFTDAPLAAMDHGDGRWLAVTAGAPDGRGGPPPGPSTFSASGDGRTWEQVRTHPEAITALAHGGPGDEAATSAAATTTEPPTTAPPATETSSPSPAAPVCTREALQAVPVIPLGTPYRIEQFRCSGTLAGARTREGTSVWGRLFRWDGDGWVDDDHRSCDGAPEPVRALGCPAG